MFLQSYFIKYHFSVCGILKEVQITAKGTPSDIAGLYSGKMNMSRTRANEFTGNMYSSTNTKYYVYVSQDSVEGTPIGRTTVEIRRRSDNVVLFRFQESQRFPDIYEFDMNAVSGSGATGTMRQHENI